MIVALEAENARMVEENARIGPMLRAKEVLIAALEARNGSVPTVGGLRPTVGGLRSNTAGAPRDVTGAGQSTTLSAIINRLGIPSGLSMTL